MASLIERVVATLSLYSRTVAFCRPNMPELILTVDEDDLADSSLLMRSGGMFKSSPDILEKISRALSMMICRLVLLFESRIAGGSANFLSVAVTKSVCCEVSENMPSGGILWSQEKPTG